MRFTFALLAVSLLAGCSGSPPIPDPVVQCSEPRPQVCTMEYDPVCATLAGGDTKQYASPCNACAHDTVLSYFADSCPSLEPDAGAAK